MKWQRSANPLRRHRDPTSSADADVNWDDLRVDSSVSFDPRGPSLRFADGVSVTANESVAFPWALEPELLAEVSVGDLARAIGEWTEQDPLAATWLLWPPGSARSDRRREVSVGVCLHYSAEFGLSGVAIPDLEHDEDPEFEATIPRLLLGMTRAGSATLRIDADPLDGKWVAAYFTVEPGRRVSELTSLAYDALALTEAGLDGPVGLDATYELLASGHVSALIGMTEGVWLDAKAAPYQLDGERGKWELAKDVAAFANADGGIIVLPVRTVVERGVETLSGVRPCPSDQFDAQQYRDALADRVFPKLRGLVVDFVVLADRRGYGYVYVPSQRVGDRPFLIRGELIGDAVKSHAVTIPWRDDDDTRFDDIGTVHAALKAYADKEDGRAQVVETVRMERLSALHQAIVHAAREVGLRVDLAAQGYTISPLEGQPIVVEANPRFVALEGMEIDRVLRALEAHGVEVVTTPRGSLVPAGWLKQVGQDRPAGGLPKLARAHGSSLSVQRRSTGGAEVWLWSSFPSAVNASYVGSGRRREI